MIKIYLTIFCFSLCLTSFSQEYHAELVAQETRIEVNRKSLTGNFYYQIKINNRAGDSFANIEIPFSNLTRVSKIEAFIMDAEGKIIRKIKKGDISEKSSVSDLSFYEDNLVKEFSLKHNSYPYTIVYSYQLEQDQFININYWIPIINEKIPTLAARLVVTTPSDYKVAFKNQFVDDPVIDTANSKITYQWNASYREILAEENFSPPLVNYLPGVKIIPVEFNFEREGSFRDWISFGNWQYEILQGLNELPEQEKARISSLIEDTEDKREKIKRLYHYLQDETRYINVTIETGGLKPYDATYVALNKYGDCKALTNYFKSVLEFAGIKSCYTKIYAGSPIIDIDRDFPSQQSNHIILYIPMEDEDIWLDCTSDGAFNYLGTFTQNRDALIIEKDNSRFVRTPALTAADVAETRKIETTYSADIPGVKFTSTYRGDSYETILYLEKYFNGSEKAQIINNFLVTEGSHLNDFKIYHSDRDSTQITLSYNAANHNIYRHYGSDMVLGNFPFPIPDLEKPQVRKLPVSIDYPIFKRDTVIYDIPEDYRPNTLPGALSIISRYGEYKREAFAKGGNIVIIKSLLINSGRYPLTEYSDFYNFYSKIIETENQPIISLSK